MSKIKKADEVIVISGKDKGKHGKVLKVFPTANVVLVEGINMVHKHVKPDPRTGTQGGIITREAKIDISNVAIYNPMTKKADRIGYRVLEDGRKVRIFKSNNELVEI
jgi:large subunit ribosomal protein L24